MSSRLRPTADFARLRQARAITLFEALLAVMLVGLAATAFTSALSAGLTQDRVAMQHAVAANLAAGLVDEILVRPLRDPNNLADRTPGPDAGETSRPLYDNIDDYHDLQEAAGQLRGPDGALLTDATLAGFSRSARAVYTRLPGQDASSPATFILVTVEVKHDGVSLVTLKRLMSAEERSRS